MLLTFGDTTFFGVEIKHVSAYHSVEYLDEGMKLYKYFDIGPGVMVNYGSTEFTLSYTIERELSQDHMCKRTLAV